MNDKSLPLALIALGSAWLLFDVGWIPDIDWIVAFALAGSGGLILLLDGLNARTLVKGPMLIAAGGAWLGYFRYGMRFSTLVPMLMIAQGSLMLAARALRPAPRTQVVNP